VWGLGDRVWSVGNRDRNIVSVQPTELFFKGELTFYERKDERSASVSVPTAKRRAINIHCH
jgi:hypothetical protein